MSGEDEDGFVSLWPTTLLSRSLPGHDAANRVLALYLQSLDEQTQGLTTQYRDNDLLDQDHPALKWLKACIDRSANDYLLRQGVDYPVRWTLQAWANINRLGDYHNVHNHPRAYLSGTYYVAMPSDTAVVGSRDDLSSGAISFYDPRGAVNMQAIAQDGEVEAEYLLRPSAGTILMWPAWLNHFVHPNLSKEPRISISFNVILKWSDSYLPSQ